MSKVVCFGELLMRLTPTLSGEWIAENKMPVFIGGAEANVAVALAKWAIPTAYVTAVPENFLSKQLVGFLHDKGVNTSNILYTGSRLGLYYLSAGADLKSGGVIYDREYSSFSGLKPGMINWDEVFKDATWFHFSAICPALNQNISDVCEEALKAASERNITISVDLNYREKLWQYGKKPSEVMPDLVQYCDVIMGNVWAANTMLNIPVSGNLGNREDYLQQAIKSSEDIIRNYPECKTVANTFRFTGESKIDYYAALYTNNQLYASCEYHATEIVDKVGSGDCFMAGLIYGIIQNKQPQEIIDFATAAAFEKLFIKGDSTDKTVEEILKTIINE